LREQNKTLVKNICRLYLTAKKEMNEKNVEIERLQALLSINGVQVPLTPAGGRSQSNNNNNQNGRKGNNSSTSERRSSPYNKKPKTSSATFPPL
jgi:hypothetical protein